MLGRVPLQVDSPQDVTPARTLCPEPYIIGPPLSPIQALGRDPSGGLASCTQMWKSVIPPRQYELQADVDILVISTSLSVSASCPSLPVEVMPQPASTHSSPRKSAPCSARLAIFTLLLSVAGVDSFMSAISLGIPLASPFQPE